jgi:hypothetical protein
VPIGLKALAALVDGLPGYSAEDSNGSTFKPIRNAVPEHWP